MKKIVFISSTGGHWSQLQVLLNEVKLRDEKVFNISVITEKNKTNNDRRDLKFLIQQDRKKPFILFVVILNIYLSVKYLINIKPDVVVSTGAGVVLPYLLLAKMLKSKIIFIESYAKVTSPTLTGRFVYKFADEFYVQWPELLACYPDAIYKGSLY